MIKFISITRENNSKRQNPCHFEPFAKKAKNPHHLLSYWALAKYLHFKFMDTSLSCESSVWQVYRSLDWLVMEYLSFWAFARKRKIHKFRFQQSVIRILFVKDKNGVKTAFKAACALLYAGRLTHACRVAGLLGAGVCVRGALSHRQHLSEQIKRG